MSKKALDRLKAQLGDRILETSSLRGDDEAVVAPKDWLEVARFLRDDGDLRMDHFIDITAIDYPLRETLSATGALARFDVVLLVRSMTNNQRVRLKARIAEGESIPSLVSIWAGANWGEREVYDMFGVRFSDHPDMRRILLYEEFIGHPLRKDYPIEKAQPLIPYRDVEGTDKLPPFGPEEGQPWARIDWQQRLEHRDFQVSPAIGVQQRQRPTLSQGIEYTDQDDASVASAKD